MEKAASRARQERSGRWRALYIDASGKEVSAGTYPTKEQARDVARRQAEWRGGRELSPLTRATATFAEIGDLWLEYKKPFLKQGTWFSYQGTFQRHVLPALGDARLVETRHVHIFRLFQAWESAGMGIAVRRDCRTVIKGIYAHARRLDIVQDDRDPTKGIEIKGRLIKPVRILTEEEWFRLYEALPTEGARLLAVIRLVTGLRINEAIALTPSCVDEDDVLLAAHVTNELPLAADENFERAEGTKGTREGSGGSVEVRGRNIQLPPEVAEQWWAFVDKHSIPDHEEVFLRGRVIPTRRRRLDVVETGDEFVYSDRTYRHGTTTAYSNGWCRCRLCKAAYARYRRENRKSRAGEGGRKSRRRFSDHDPVVKGSWRYWWAKACDEAGLGWYPNAYQLRHTYASWLSQAGLSDEKIARLLGHRDTNTIKHYIHNNHADPESAEIMGEVLRGERRVTPPPRRRRRAMGADND